jgi:hypothetical protein
VSVIVNRADFDGFYCYLTAESSYIIYLTIYLFVCLFLLLPMVYKSDATHCLSYIQVRPSKMGCTVTLA